MMKRGRRNRGPIKLLLPILRLTLIHTPCTRHPSRFIPSSTFQALWKPQSVPIAHGILPLPDLRITRARF